MKKDNKKDTHQLYLTNIELTSYTNNLYSYSKTKRGLLQWLLKTVW